MNLPLWLLRLLPMWDYQCPVCQRRSDLLFDNDRCRCGELFNPEKWRIPPSILKNRKELRHYVLNILFPKLSKHEQRIALKLFPPHSISFDSASSAQGSAASFSWNHTTNSLSYRLLLVAVSIRNDSSQTVSSVTYDSVSLTRLRVDTNSTNVRTEIWYLLNPTYGTKQIVVSLSASAKTVCGAITLMGVNQATPFSANNGATGSSNSPLASLTSEADDWLFAVLAARGTVTATEGAGQTNRWNLVTSGGLATTNVRGCGSTKGPVTAGSQSMSWTLSASATWAVSVCSIKEEPGTTLFSDGFENAFTPWTGVTNSTATITQSARYPHHGRFSAFVSNASAGEGHYAYVYKDLGASLFALRLYFYWASGGPASGDVEGMKFAQFSGANGATDLYFSVLVYYDGTNYLFGVHYWNITVGEWLDAQSAVTVSRNQYYCVEIDATSTSYTLYINGKNVLSDDTIDCSAPICIAVGDAYSGVTPTYTYYLDCIIAADAYAGPEAAGSAWKVLDRGGDQRSKTGFVRSLKLKVS